MSCRQKRNLIKSYWKSGNSALFECLTAAGGSCSWDTFLRCAMIRQFPSFEFLQFKVLCRYIELYSESHNNPAKVKLKTLWAEQQGWSFAHCPWNITLAGQLLRLKNIDKNERKHFNLQIWKFQKETIKVIVDDVTGIAKRARLWITHVVYSISNRL